jgi:hypothetical protein
MMAQFQDLLEEIVENPDQELDTLGLSVERDNQQLLYSFNETIEQFI